jgi:ADP-dependent NAD(P)H-hydrate dehydratase / NAD(P)H-hydrate epimerase
MPASWPRRILPDASGAWIAPSEVWPLHGRAASQAIERELLAGRPPFATMLQAGTAVARLCLALAPRGGPTWVLAGPGNNGGDGLVAATLLHRAGHAVQVLWLGDEQRMPADAREALTQARQAGVSLSHEVPTTAPPHGRVIDALLGLGSTRAPQGALAEALRLFNGSQAPLRLAVDLPTGLDADTGCACDATGDLHARATHTLALLTLKPGLFTAAGRDAAGEIWLDTLDADPATLSAHPAQAWLAGAPLLLAERQHASHKGSFGDVLVVGGAAGMRGAALLAGRAALAAGAGRVYASPVANPSALATAREGTSADTTSVDRDVVDAQWPELMLRAQAWDADPGWLRRCTVVAGCGGGEAMAAVLAPLLQHAPRLVLDADGLNAVAGDAQLRALLARRQARGQASILTPHPLEAARLLGRDVSAVQGDRLQAAQALADEFGCTVVLKGSGTVLAAAGQTPWINPSGTAALASAGTGDVLAGWIGGRWSAAPQPTEPLMGGVAPGSAAVRGALPLSVQVALRAVWEHGRAANLAAPRRVLRASELLRMLQG